MSAQDNTFIDAYGLELNEELGTDRAELAREPMPRDEMQQPERSYRFDAAARRRTLRGPHFDMRSVGPSTGSENLAGNALDLNVIDVGAAWTSSTVIAPSSFEDEPVVAPSSLDGAFAGQRTDTFGAATAEETVEVNDEEVEEVIAPVASQPATPPDAVEEVTSPAQPAASEIETPAVATPPPATNSTDGFAPAWEVDRFHWPNDIEQLFLAQTEYFDYAGKKLVAASREGLGILAITSTRSGAGSTTLALCLARAAAGAGARVGLLDGNLVRSELGETLGVDFASGWQTAATSEQPLAEAAITGLEEKITLFPSAAAPVAEIQSLGDPRVGHIFRAAAANYDLLIIDAGQADLGDNIAILDAAIVVRDIRNTSKEETLAAATAIRDRGVKAVGIAENFGSSQATRAAA